MSDFLNAIILPAFIAGALYFLFALVILPFVRQHRHRYDQYLPVHSLSDTVASRTSSFRDRIADTITAFVIPSFHRRHNAQVVDGSNRRGSSSSEEPTFAVGDAEDMVGFDVRDISRRREELRRDVSGMEGATRSVGLSSLPHEQSHDRIEE